MNIPDTCCRRFNCPHLTERPMMKHDYCNWFGIGGEYLIDAHIDSLKDLQEYKSNYICTHIQTCSTLAAILRERKANEPVHVPPNICTASDTLVVNVESAGTATSNMFGHWKCPRCEFTDTLSSAVAQHMKHCEVE